MTDYVAVLTAYGAAALAAAQGGAPIVLTTLTIGDANGAPYVPTGAEVGLVHQVATTAVASAGSDPAHPAQLLITGVFPIDAGGFTVREVGVFSADGHLFAIANYPPTYKPDPVTEGGAVELAIRMPLAIAGTPNVTVVLSGASYVTTDVSLAQRNFFALVASTVTAPPGGPAQLDAYLVPAGAADAWAGQDGKIAIWRGAAWLFVTAATGSHAFDTSINRSFRRTATGWTRAGMGPAERDFRGRL